MEAAKIRMANISCRCYGCKRSKIEVSVRHSSLFAIKVALISLKWLQTKRSTKYCVPQNRYAVIPYDRLPVVTRHCDIIRYVSESGPGDASLFQTILAIIWHSLPISGQASWWGMDLYWKKGNYSSEIIELPSLVFRMEAKLWVSSQYLNKIMRSVTLNENS